MPNVALEFREEIRLPYLCDTSSGGRRAMWKPRWSRFGWGRLKFPRLDDEAWRIFIDDLLRRSERRPCLIARFFALSLSVTVYQYEEGEHGEYL